MNQEQIKVKLEAFKEKAQQRLCEFKTHELPVLKESFEILKKEVGKVVAKVTKK